MWVPARRDPPKAPEPEPDAGITMELSAAELEDALEAELEVTPALELEAELELEVEPELEPAVEPVRTAEIAPSVERPAQTRPCMPAAVRAVPVRELPELPSTASCVRPLSESTWSVAALGEDDLALPRRSGWWRYTLVSAGATALVCSLGFTLAGEPAPASAASRPAEPTVISYDPAALEATGDEVDVAAPAPHREGDAVLARRIALRGTRNLEVGRTRLARAAFEEALGHDPECRPALAGLGRIHFAAGRHHDAARYLATAVKIEPRDAELQGMLAQAYRAIGHHQSAARHERLASRHGG